MRCEQQGRRVRQAWGWLEVAGSGPVLAGSQGLPREPKPQGGSWSIDQPEQALKSLEHGFSHEK